jgi:hypothetical protein
MKYLKNSQADDQQGIILQGFPAVINPTVDRIGQ